MAKKRETKKSAEVEAPQPMGSEIPPMETFSDGSEIETTGRYIVIFKDEAVEDGKIIESTLSDIAGLKNIASAVDYEDGAVPGDDLAENEVTHFNNLGIAVITSEEAMVSLAASTSDADSPILAIEPEYIAHPTSHLTENSHAYLTGYRDAVNHLYEKLTSEQAVSDMQAQIAAVFQDNAQFTWGLQATKANTSRFSGRGIKVAILDTGFDLAHPDFIGRAVTSRSFVAGITSAQDIHGHGTHCIGTACGSQRPASGVRRYGVAFNAQIFAGKVFNNNPRPGAATADVIAGIEWAITNGCRVVSLSLGIPVNQTVMQYNTPLRRALNAGTLVVAAAGNNANRPGLPGFRPDRPPTNGFVEPPANANDAMAIAALDSQMRIAVFSARSSQLTGIGGIVNLAAPGVGVFSSIPVNLGRHASFNGTSMATPHVAGIAALWAEATGSSGRALWNRLVQTALPLNLLSSDVGSGMVQAPQ